MEYNREMFLSDGDGLVLRLCKLMTSFDQASAVMPYRPSKAVSRYDLWLEETNEKKTVSVYVGGAEKTVEGLKLCLRHRAVTAEDIAEAEEILTFYTTRLDEVIGETDTYRVNVGRILHCETDESVWDFCAEFEIFRYEPDDNNGVRFFVSFGETAAVPVSTGCTEFCERICGKLHSRRYFDEPFYRNDDTGVMRSISFEFETDLARCALYPILHGEREVRVYRVLETGEAETAVFVISECSVTEEKCVGELVSTGVTEQGRFDFDTGGFVPDVSEGSVVL